MPTTAITERLLRIWRQREPGHLADDIRCWWRDTRNRQIDRAIAWYIERMNRYEDRFD